MTDYVEFVDSALSVDDILKVAGLESGNRLVGDEWVWDMLDKPSGERPRIYAYLEPEPGEAHGQIVKLTSRHYVEKYAGRISFAWTSNYTIRDIIHKAGGNVGRW